MRNWNKRIKANFIYDYRFLQYLWGIETPFCAKFYTSHVLSFYSTYEELKPVGEARAILPLGEFLQYLWGIETFLFDSKS